MAPWYQPRNRRVSRLRRALMRLVVVSVLLTGVGLPTLATSHGGGEAPPPASEPPAVRQWTFEAVPAPIALRPPAPAPEPVEPPPPPMVSEPEPVARSTEEPQADSSASEEVSAAPTVEPGEPPVRRALVIGIDGLRPDCLEKAKTPNLDALRKKGAWSLNARATGLTLSGPGWATMLTGVTSRRHGVVDNTTAQRGVRRTLFDRLRAVQPDAYTAALVGWRPLVAHLLKRTRVDVKKWGHDQKVTHDAIEVLRESEPTLVFVHFDSIDRAGHALGYGPDQPAYMDAIEQVDQLVGVLLRELEQRQSSRNEDWLVLATTDHGGSGRHHVRRTPINTRIFWIAAAPGVSPGEIGHGPALVDVAPTVLAYLGVAVKAEWRLEGRVIERALPPLEMAAVDEEPSRQAN